jgi:histidinol-phosphate aminotransferase
MTASLYFDLEALEHELSDAPQVFFLPSPWNPVGPALDRPSLERLARSAPPSTLFVLDEAYREFAEQSSPDGIELLRSFGIPHVVLRTFSKAWGLAGLRVGYAVCSDAEIARVIANAKTPFNVNAAAQIAAMAALDDERWMRDSVARVSVERERVREALTALGFKVAPSQGNFLFFDCGIESSTLHAELVKEGIIVKAWNERGYERYVRATIGLPQENDRLIAALARRTAR